MDQRGGVGAITQAGGVHEALREDGTVHIAVPTPVLRALTIQTPDNCQRSDRGVWALPEFMTQDPESFKDEEIELRQTPNFYETRRCTDHNIYNLLVVCMVFTMPSILRNSNDLDDLHRIFLAV